MERSHVSEAIAVIIAMGASPACSEKVPLETRLQDLRNDIVDIREDVAALQVADAVARYTRRILESDSDCRKKEGQFVCTPQSPLSPGRIAPGRPIGVIITVGGSDNSATNISASANRLDSLVLSDIDSSGQAVLSVTESSIDFQPNGCDLDGTKRVLSVGCNATSCFVGEEISSLSRTGGCRNVLNTEVEIRPMPGWSRFGKKGKRGCSEIGKCEEIMDSARRALDTRIARTSTQHIARRR